MEGELLLRNAAAVLWNGLLVSVLGVLSRWPFGAVLELGAAWVLLVERALIARAQVAAGGRKPASHLPVWLGSAAWALGLLAMLLYPTPVAELVAVLWLAALAVVLVLPSGRWEAVPTARLFLLGYALFLLAFRPLAHAMEQADPYAWASVFGSTGEAREALARSRSLVLTVFTWLAWFALPGGFCLWAFQRVAALGFSFAAPGATVADLVRAIRQRR